LPQRDELVNSAIRLEISKFFPMKNQRLINFTLSAFLALTVALLGACSNSPRVGPLPVRLLMKIRKHRQKQADASPTPSPASTNSLAPAPAPSPAYGSQEAAPAPGGIIRGIIESRLQQTQ
jgi:hypothetical protein